MKTKAFFNLNQKREWVVIHGDYVAEIDVFRETKEEFLKFYNYRYSIHFEMVYLALQIRPSNSTNKFYQIYQHYVK